MLKDLITDIVKELVEHKDDVFVEEIESDKSATYQIQVMDEDKGRVIGKKGKTINSIRAIATAVAKREGRRAQVEILEEFGDEDDDDGDGHVSLSDHGSGD